MCHLGSGHIDICIAYALIFYAQTMHYVIYVSDFVVGSQSIAGPLIIKYVDGATLVKHVQCRDSFMVVIPPARFQNGGRYWITKTIFLKCF